MCVNITSLNETKSGETEPGAQNLGPRKRKHKNLDKLIEIVFTVVVVVSLAVVLSTLTLQVLGRVGVGELEAERFRHQDADMRVHPAVGRQVLQQQHQALKVLLLQQLFAPVQQKRRTHVQLEHGKAVRLGQIGVPQPDRTVQWQFAG